MGSIRLSTEIPGPRSRELEARRAAAIPRGVSAGAPVYVERAEGATLTDVDGNRFIDFAGGIGVINAGHSQPAVVRAVQEQAERFLHTCFMVAPYEGYLRLAEELAAIAPGTGPKKTLLVNSGAEAVENAVKIARHFTGRQGVVVFTHAFHGRTQLALTMTAKHATYKRGFGPFAPEVYRLPYPYEYREASAAEALDRFRHALHDELGEANVACVVMELVAGEGGFIPAPPSFVAGVAEACREHGILFVADEVQTGFGRTGRMWASEHHGIQPDLVCIAKSVAAGLPLAAVVGRAEVMDGPQVGGLGSTFGGNPVACAAALATLEVFREQGLVERAAAIGERVHDRFHRWWEEFDVVGDARGLGAMAAVELVRDKASKEPAADLTERLYRRAYERGVITVRAGTYNNVLRFLAPLVITDDELDEGLDVLERGLREVADGA